jgi:hypothetical protein
MMMYGTMPSKVTLFVMEGCETCEEMQRRLQGRGDVDIINVDTQPERTRELVRKLEAQGDIGVIDALPQCILQRSDGRFERCDTEHIEQVLEEQERSSE